MVYRYPTCGYCGERIGIADTGRPRQYCNRSCARKAASRRARELREMPEDKREVLQLYEALSPKGRTAAYDFIRWLGQQP